MDKKLVAIRKTNEREVRERVLSAYLDARAQTDALRSDPEVVLFERQIALLTQRLLEDPRSLQPVLISQGMRAIAYEFQQDELSKNFTIEFWKQLLLDNDMSKVLMRFLWDMPLKYQRKFIKAIDMYLSDRYPFFKGLSNGWPNAGYIPPYIRPASERNKDFDLVNQGYLGYMGLGYSFREVELLVWLEALRDKKCEDRPCQVGVCKPGKDEVDGGCPVKIHIPEMLRLVGQGKFREALELLVSANPLPDVTGRICPQEVQCQGVCTHTETPIAIGQLEWYLQARANRLAQRSQAAEEVSFVDNPWLKSEKPPVAVVGSGPAGLINAYLLLRAGYPVAVFEAFHDLGGVLRYGIPEFRLPNKLIDDVVREIKRLGGIFVTNFIVGKTAALDELRKAGFSKIFIGTGAGLPRFMNIPGEHLCGVMSANEHLTRINLMHAYEPGYETPILEFKGKRVIVVGGGNTAMDAARSAKRLGADVTIVYRRTEKEMPVRVEELHHAVEEGISVLTLHNPVEFLGDERGFLRGARLEVMELGEPDKSGRRSPKGTGRIKEMPVNIVIMALGNASNPIIKNSEPGLKTTKWGTIAVDAKTQETSIPGVFSGGDATRGGATAILAAGDGQNAASTILNTALSSPEAIRQMVDDAKSFLRDASAEPEILDRREVADGIVEFKVYAPIIARSAKAGQFVRVLADKKGEFIPLTLADWDVNEGTITLVVQRIGRSTTKINSMKIGEAFIGVTGPMGKPSHINKYEDGKSVVFTAGGVGLAPVYPILLEHLKAGNRVVLICGFRSKDQKFWIDEGERIHDLKAKYSNLEVVYTTNDGSFGEEGFVTTPLQRMLDERQAIGEVLTIGPSIMMRAVSSLTQRYGVKTTASLNAIMVDATGMCGSCMVPTVEAGKLVRNHACIDGPEFDAHKIDWGKFLPRLLQFRDQETREAAAELPLRISL